MIVNKIKSINLNIFLAYNFQVKTVIKTPKMQKNNNIYQLVNTHILMSMLQWNHAANLKWIWWELHRKLDLIRNFNIFSQATFFLSKNTEKTPKNTENHKIYQLEIMHILISMIQWIHVAGLLGSHVISDIKFPFWLFTNFLPIKLLVF